MIELRDITRVYNSGMQPVHALRGVTLKIHSGEFVAIMGASGSGKSTLMNLIGCLDRPTSGQYLLDDENVESLSEDALARVRNRKIGFVFQQFNLLPRMNALENVAIPLLYAGVPGDERKERAEQALRLVGLGDRLSHRPNQLSGGQQQRVAIARAIVNKPHILLADEPTGALDSQTAGEIMTLLEELHASGMSVVLVTHEAEIAAYARRVIRLKDGLVISDTASVPGRAPAG
ncbi:MAG TPA: ABC transporter ATP-binding protein [Candidatus Obscuribacterales bacterium]